MYENIVQLKFTASDGKKYATDCLETKNLFRLVQSVPSPKAEPFKLWLAKVGSERLDEIADPEKGIDRLMETYLKKVYSKEWVNQRLKSIEVRKDLTDEWENRGVKKGQEYVAFRWLYFNLANSNKYKSRRMNLKNSQLEVDNWIKEHGVRYFNELTNMAQLTEEVGEVARIIARRYGEQSEKESDKNKDLGEELADVVFVVLCLANQTGIDLQAAFDKKMDLKSVRDKDRHHNNEKLH